MIPYGIAELKLLSTAIVTEIIRREDKKHPSEDDKQKIAMLTDLGNRVDNEKMAKFKELKEKGVV